MPAAHNQSALLPLISCVSIPRRVQVESIYSSFAKMIINTKLKQDLSDAKGVREKRVEKGFYVG